VLNQQLLQKDNQLYTLTSLKHPYIIIIATND